MRGRLYHVEDDWYEWCQQPALAGKTLLRVVHRGDGRLGLAELRIVGEPTSELLRSIPIGRIEAAANAQLTFVDDSLAPAPLRRHRRSARPRFDANDTGWDQPVAGPAGRRKRSAGRPDRFYADVAATYRELAQTSRRPAVELAARHDVPVTTAHRWIKEARRRGHLAPGRPGKAG